MTDKITRFFKENDKTLSAKQIAEYPYPECRKVLSEQVALYRKNQQMGQKAKDLLAKLRSAEKIALVEIKANKNSFFYLNQEPIDSIAARQLIDRGFIL